MSAPPPRTTHRLKSWPANFSAVLTGRKRFEIRRDDRGILPGDAVTLEEFDPTDGEDGPGQPRGFTGRRATYLVGYVERGPMLPAGWCGFDLVSVEDANRIAPALLRPDP